MADPGKMTRKPIAIMLNTRAEPPAPTGDANGKFGPGNQLAAAMPVQCMPQAATPMAKAVIQPLQVAAGPWT